MNYKGQITYEEAVRKINNFAKNMEELGNINKQTLLSILEQDKREIITSVVIIIQKLLDNGIQRDDVCVLFSATMTGSPVDKNIRKYFPKEWFNEKNGTMLEPYTHIFNPDSGLGIYECIISDLDLISLVVKTNHNAEKRRQEYLMQKEAKKP